MVPRNQRMVVENSFQGSDLRVLCICSGGVLRSPTAAEILSAEPFRFNTRSCGSESFALVPLNEALTLWADEVICFDERHMRTFMDMFNAAKGEDDVCPLVHVLHIEDDFDFRDPWLVTELGNRFNEIFGER